MTNAAGPLVDPASPSLQLRVAEIWRYPVKSLGGERVTAALVGDAGIEGDRVRGILDLDTGKVLTARRAPQLLFASASYRDGEVIITLPDGVETADDAVLSRWLERDVTLRAPSDHGATYENPMDVENDADWVSWQGPGGSFHDSGGSRMSLVSRTSLGQWDQRRFRSNVILDGSNEDGLVGARVAVGDEVVLEITKRIDRCVMVTRPQPGLERDLAVLKDINRYRQSSLSVGAVIQHAGLVAEGDVVREL
jgi:uncharacterized protein